MAKLWTLKIKHIEYINDIKRLNINIYPRFEFDAHHLVFMNWDTIKYEFR